MRLVRHKRFGDYGFVSPKTGTRFKDIKHSFQKAWELAGIEGLVWHDLRTTFGPRLGEAGFDAFTIAQLMGHSDVRTTQRYVRATELNKRAVVEAALLDHNLATRKRKQADFVAVSA
jgi:integrase